MIYLILSVVASSCIYLLFKWFGKWGIHVFEAIVTNYIVAFLIGIFMINDLAGATKSALEWPIWSVAGVCLGFVFISVFYLMAITAQKVGVSVTTIASKMSLALAVLLFALFDTNETMGIWKWLAITLALFGVVLSSLHPNENKFKWQYLVWPLIILIGSTIIDFSIPYFIPTTNVESDLQLYSCLPFLMASIVGIIIVVKHYFTPGYRIRVKDLAAGILLGIINYGSIFFLVKSYNSGVFSKSTTLPINNLSIVIVGSAAAVILFKEKLFKLNILGLVLSILSLLILLLNP